MDVDWYYHLSNPFVAPMSMDYQKPLEEPELRNREVASHHSLQTVKRALRFNI